MAVDGRALCKQLTEKILPGLVSDGKFGEGMVCTKVDAAPVGGLGTDHWASSTFLAELEVQKDGNKDGKTSRTFSLVTKFMTSNDGFKDFMEMQNMADNEEHMYNVVLPFFTQLWNECGAEEPLELFPKCYHAQSGATPFIVMENMKKQGFRLTEERCILDRDHVFLALRKLGLFHAFSFAAKVRRKTEFLPMAHIIKETSFTERTKPFQSEMLKGCVARAFDRLASRGDEVIDGATVEKLRECLKDPFTIMTDAITAEEPLAVITHGDFCRNNIMFKYDEKTGKPVDVRFFDFQTPRYGVPAVDLAFFIFLNTSSEMRAEHLEDMFLVYYDGLSSTMRRLLSSEPGLSPTMDIPSLNSLKANFARHALYGFCICSFFLPMMTLAVEDVPGIEELGDDNTAIYSVGGEPATEMLADLLHELVKNGQVHKLS